MKNSNLFKKFAAIVVSAMMVLSTLAVPTFAATSTTLRVKGVDGNATVKAYQIVTKDNSNNWVMVGDYGDEGTGDNAGKWFVKGTQIEYNFESPSEAALNALAAIAKGKTETFTFTDKDGDDWVKAGQSNVGSYLILAEATKDVDTVYNPMLVSINPDGAGVVDDNQDPKGKNVIEATTANAKKSDIPFEKVVERDNSNGRVNTGTNADNTKVTLDEATVDGDGVNSTGTNGLDGNRGDTADRADTVTYRINTMIPNYKDNYFMAENDGTYKEKYSQKVNGEDFYNPTFNVYDTFTGGLSLVTGSVKVYERGGAELEKVKDGVTLYEVVETGAKDGADNVTFKVNFTPAGVKEYRSKYIEVRYQAEIVDHVYNADGSVKTPGHGENFDGEKNTAYPKYSRKPGQDGTGDEAKGPEKKTYHYTFTINGKINGKNSVENREVIKIGLDESDNFVYSEKTTFASESGWRPLEGVTFKLFKAGEDWTKGSEVRTAKTDAAGILRGMDQLDAGRYILVEEDLGNNKEFAKNTTPIYLEIRAVLDTLGRLTGYTVKVGDNKDALITVGDYTKTYTGEEEGLAANGKLGGDIMNDAGSVLDDSKVANKVVYNNGTADDTSDDLTWKDNDADAADIINTKVGTLPNTGGMGTVIFTVGGIAIMALAIFLLFGGKKKKEQE